MNKFRKEKLEACMLYANFDVRELAESSNVAPTTIYEILSGKKKNPQAETLSKLSGALSTEDKKLFEAMLERLTKVE